MTPKKEHNIGLRVFEYLEDSQSDCGAMLRSTNGLQHLSKTIPRSQPQKPQKIVLVASIGEPMSPVPTLNPSSQPPKTLTGVETNPMGVSK